MSRDISHDIAIVAMAGRFPEAPDIEAFWANLLEGRECVRHFSDEDLAEAGILELVRDVPGYVPARAVIDRPEYFDAGFFGFSPAEAKVTDPQQRVFLEVAWEALELAGCDPKRCDELIGVYAGVDVASYATGRLPLWTHDLATLIGNDKDYLASRVAYKLDLRGPAVVVQTACSTSLVAVQSACQALLGYQCDVALAGGVGIAFPQVGGYVYQEGGILSPDGRCRPFDAQARGTVGGDGCGVVVLKRLGDALAARDPIRAVIRGAAINNDGSDKIGYTAPSVTGQADVIAMAQALARVSPDTIGYVEAHGTGTQLGDPIEVAALTEVFREQTDRTNFCALGSVKANVGHMNSAAGVGGLIKAALCVERGVIPGNPHFETANPALNLEESPFRVPRETTPWVGADQPRRAAVSSFGVGGTNAHVVLEEAPSMNVASLEPALYPIVVSARTPLALDQATQRLHAHLAATPDLRLPDVSWTLLAGRQRFAHRRLLFARDRETGLTALADPPPSLRVDAPRRSVMFLLPGQGAQYPGMTRGLYSSHAVFRQVVDDCSQHLEPRIGVDLRTMILGDSDAADALNQTAHTQPALFVVELALARLLDSWGVRPDAMLGHSVGEYVAACTSGVFTVEEGLDLLAARGRLIQDLPGGSMLAVALGEDAAVAATGLEVAALNAPDLTVLSGTDEAIEAAVGSLAEADVACTVLHTSHAFHSAMMDPMLDAFRAVVDRVDLRAPEIPFVSNVTGSWITEAQATDPGYWVQHIRRPVRFSEGLRRLRAETDPLFVEVGPGTTLAGLVARHDPDQRGRVVTTVRHPRRDDPDDEVMIRALGHLYVEGADVEWGAVYEGRGLRRVILPTYPFQRERYWQEPAVAASSAATLARGSNHELVSTPSWHRTLAPRVRAEGYDLLILLDSADAGGEAVAAEVGARHTVYVRRDSAFEVEGPSAIRMDPDDREHWARLLEQLPAADRVAVVDLWPLDASPGFEGAQEAGLYPLLRLGQCLGPRRADVVVAARGTADPTGADGLTPETAPLLAAARILPQEFPGLRCRVLDTDRVADLPTTVPLELGAEGPPHVAWRGGRRWIPMYSPAGDQLPDSTEALRDRGVYLITGGLGTIGLALAEHLAGRVAARLVLTSRSGLVAREEWDGWLSSHRDDDPQSVRIRRIRAMESVGAEVEVVSADVADPVRMRHVMGRIEKRFGDLHGVIHAAGSAGHQAFRAVADTEPEHCRAHFRAKVRGTEVLAEVLPADLDFVLLLSSLSTTVGGAGLLAYAAANHHLDALAEARGDGWIAVGLDAWAPQAGGPLSTRGISPEQGVALLERIVGRPDARRWVVSAGPLEQRIAEAARAPDEPGAPSERVAGGERHARPDLDVPWVGPRDEIEAVVLEIWEDVLGIDGIGVDDSFFKLGGESLMAIQIGTRLRDGLGVDVPINELFENATPAGAARTVRRAQAEQRVENDVLGDVLARVESMSDDEVRRMLAELEGEA